MTDAKSDVLGTLFNNVSFDEAAKIAYRLTSAGGYCVTPNPEFVLTARKDKEFAELINNAGLSVADGIGVIYASNIIKVRLVSKIPGIDLAESIMRMLSADPNERGVFLFGAKPGVAELAAKNLAEKLPGLKISGVRDGYNYNVDEVIAEIDILAPSLVLVCLGMKKQEEFMALATRRCNNRCLMMGLGGALDAFAGTVVRAPERWQRANLEWLYRLIKQPSRIARMIKLPFIILLAIKQRLFKR